MSINIRWLHFDWLIMIPVLTLESRRNRDRFMARWKCRYFRDTFPLSFGAIYEDLQRFSLLAMPPLRKERIDNLTFRRAHPLSARHHLLLQPTVGCWLRSEGGRENCTYSTFYGDHRLTRPLLFFFLA
jgi:hypothetical protein